MPDPREILTDAAGSVGTGSYVAERFADRVIDTLAEAGFEIAPTREQEEPEPHTFRVGMFVEFEVTPPHPTDDAAFAWHVVDLTTSWPSNHTSMSRHRDRPTFSAMINQIPVEATLRWASILYSHELAEES